MDFGAWEEMKDHIGFSRMGKPAIIGLAALLVLVAAFAGKNLVEAATANDLQISRAQAAEGEGSGVASSGASSSNASDAGADSEPQEVSASAVPASIFVHVAGAVKKPGLVELGRDARAADAVEAAGGFSKNALTTSVNLARKLQDGEQVTVAAEGDEVAVAADRDVAVPEATAEGGAQAQSSTTSLVNLNTASAAELETLPGVGPATAAKIVADREANGAFSSPEDLMRVSGIGEKKYQAIADLVCT